MASVQPIPEGYPQVTPYLIVDGASAAIGFYTQVFGFKERMRMPGPEGKLVHAELQIGESILMLADEFPEQGHRSPRSLGGTPVSLMVYVEDVDRVVSQAAELGSRILRPVEDQFYGDRSGNIEDPFGHHWTIASHVEDVSPEEMQKRMSQAAGG